MHKGSPAQDVGGPAQDVGGPAQAPPAASRIRKIIDAIEKKGSTVHPSKGRTEYVNIL